MTYSLGPTSHNFTSQRLRLNYLDWGNRDAPLLVLVHGGRDHARSWDWVAEEFRHDWHIVAPDLRGHGDSAWSPDGAYTILNFVYDLTQLLGQQSEEQATIVAHSLGGMISARYTGLYPERVKKLALIEGLGAEPDFIRDFFSLPIHERWRMWNEQQHKLAARIPRRYSSIEDALTRMQEENPHLTHEQARHLTVHGISRNEDGSYSWKFDNYIRAIHPVDISADEFTALLGRIDCPTLLAWGRDSWASHPDHDGTTQKLKNAKVVEFDNAGHWLHHDQFERFVAVLRDFLEND